MVSMSGDRQRSASTSVVQQEVNANKDSPSASTSSTTAAAAAAATNNSIKDKKMASNSSAAPTSHATSNSSAPTAAAAAAAAAASACGSNGIVPVSGPVNSSTTAARRAPANAANPAEQGQLHNEESPNHIVYRKMEHIIERMQDDSAGVSVKNVKTFMNKIPSVFTGTDLTNWMIKNLDVSDQAAEALHLAHLMSAHGYFFPVEDHILTVKNDGTLYRFQTPYFWPSNCWEPENTDYAVYLCKRTMQNKARLELADYEAENLARLQKMFSRKWEFIFMQAEAQSRVDKKRDKLERKVLDSQERAFWDVHRPVPGCVNTTEMDIKKACRMHRPIKSARHLSVAVAGGRISPSVSEVDIQCPAATIQKEIEFLRKKLARTNIKVSKVAESYISFYEQYVEYDPFVTCTEPLNPWISDTLDFWDQDKSGKEIQLKRVRRWAFSLQELLKDPVGKEHFTKFLEKEFSSENLKFWEAAQDLKALPSSQVGARAMEIWNEFLGPEAKCPVNVDSKSHEATRLAMDKPDRWTFDRAAAHVYHLMRSDSYSRYLRSEMYKDFLSGSKKKVTGRSFIVPRLSNFNITSN
ncbi:regulator of G-protein signaling 7-like isoform X1 [Daphnia pulex]|uniref:regulator of G-protein signaling 7-like isoform X1 n=1 Tax=Daphnia pulex TaxID=6669 RepID=UPI001EDE12E1|nr:regulator of G-protein signaling 7-like isoform X1 [Daphnia pulex]XP_046452913.1 regulator of G-protein signaling 7-like isoform X1 [Daphnia pulex]